MMVPTGPQREASADRRQRKSVCVWHRFHLPGGLAQMERELIGERTRTALAYKRLPNEAWRTLARLNGAWHSPTSSVVR